MGFLYWALLLLVLGLVLIGVEVFVPSAGVLGVLAASSLIASVSVGFMHSWLLGFGMLFGALLLVPLAIYGAIKVWPHTPIGKLILNTPPTEEEVRPRSPYATLVGKIGVCRSPMLPSGQIRIDQTNYDAVSAGMPIEAGQAIRVVSASGNRIVVRPYDGPAESATPGKQDLLDQPLDSFDLDAFDDPVA